MRSVLRWLTLSRLLSIIALAAVFAIALRAPLDTDTYWHLRAGEWQFSERRLLDRDIFSFSRTGEEWVNHSWLAQLILYGFYAVLGDAGLALYVALIAALALALLMTTIQGDPLVRAGVVILAAATAAVFWSARPQMLSFLLGSLTYVLLWQALRGGRDRLWLIPLLMILWANLHGGFAIGFILLVLAVLGEGLRWAFEEALPALREGKRPSVPRMMLRLVLIGLVSALAIAVNPYGIRMLLYPFQTVGIGVLRDYIQEWAAPDFHLKATWPFIWLLLGTFVAVGLSPLRLDWRDAVNVSGLAYAALLAGRNMSIFAVVCTPVLALHLDSWFKTLRFHMDWRRPPTGVFAAANWLLLALTITGVVIKGIYALNPATLQDARAAVLPVDAAAYLAGANLPGELFNSYNWGGYLIWTARDVPVFVDGRTDLYDDSLLREYLTAYFANEGWIDILAEHEINTVLIEPGAPLAKVLALMPGWRLDYAGSIAVIYVREDARN